jgi:adenylate cyclase
MSIFAELKRRNVFRVALLYLAGSWLILQIGDLIFPILEVPDWSMRLVLGLLALGLPIAILLAWTFDITPEGIRRDGDSGTPAPAKTGNSRRIDFAIIGLLAMAVMFLLLNRGDNVGELRKGLEGASTIAVLPLRLLNSDSDKDYLADGMTMSLINELSKIEALRVISLTSVRQYKNSELPLPEIAALLNVDVIVEGTVLSSGDQVRISTNLVPAESDSPAWSEVYDDNLGDVLAMQTKIARAVATQVSIELTDADQERLTPQPAVDPRVQDLIYRGQHLLSTSEGREGLNLVEEATLLAPDYAPAWVALTRAYLSWTNDDPAYLLRARSALQRALQLDENSYDAQYLKGSMALYRDWDWELAVGSLNRALELNPGYDRALQVLGDYYEMLGQYEKAIELGIRAIKANPQSSSMYMNLGLTYQYAGRAEEALAACETGIALNPNSRWAAICLAEVHEMMGNYSQAVEMADKATEGFAIEDAVLGLAAPVYAAAGRTDRVNEIGAWFDEQAQGRYVSPFFRAYVSLAREDFDEYFALIEEAVEKKAQFTPWLATVPHSAEARKDPRMQPILERLNFPAD